MSPKTRILFLTPTLKRGGAETQLVTLVNQLSGHTFDSYVISFDEGADQLNKLPSSIDFHHYLRKKKYDFETIKNIATLISNEKIDIIHCTLQISLFYGWAARLISKRKPRLLTTIHTTIHRNFRSEIIDWAVYQWIMRASDSIVFVCDEQRKHWEKKWRFIKKKGIVVHNGIDPDFFQKTVVSEQARCFRHEHSIPEDAKIVAHIAGFRPEKGHQILISAFKKALAETPNALLVFAGDGALRKHFEHIIEEENLSSNVRFIGNVSDVRPLLANAYIAVIASTAVETFSMAMLEAMSMEVPLVATDIGGTREAVIPNETGWLVPPNDVDALADALMESLSNDRIRNARAITSRQCVVNNFTLAKMATGMELLFKAITDK